MSEVDQLHPDPMIARDARIDELEGLLAEAHAGLRRALDYRAATPEGLSIKADVRDTLRRTGFVGVLGTSTGEPKTKAHTQECQNNNLLHHAATGGYEGCICGPTEEKQ